MAHRMLVCSVRGLCHYHSRELALCVLCWAPSILPCPPRLVHSMTLGKLPKQTSKSLACLPTVGIQQRTSWLFQPSEWCPLPGMATEATPLCFFLIKWLLPSQNLSPPLASDLWVTMGPQTSHCLWGWRSGCSGQRTPSLLLGTGKD